MSEATAQKVVLATVIVAGALIVRDNLKKTGKASPGAKQLVALVILAGGLMLMAQLAPGVAGPFALLILLAVVVTKVGKHG